MKYILCVIFSFFSFLSFSQVYDIDGNLYNTVIIGDQIWLQENLKVTHFNDGSPIKTELDSLTWIEIIDPAYCWYKNDSITYKPKYGALYNWYASQDERLCPVGWKVPSESDFFNLITYLDGTADTTRVLLSETVGGFLKEEGNSSWPPYENITASNSTGFTAVPAGCRGWSGWYNSAPYFGYFWTSTEWSVALRWATNRIFMNNGAGDYVAVSVRCIKDEFYTDVDDVTVTNNILIYPNPVHDILNVKILDNSTIASLKIFDLLSRLRYQKNTIYEITSINVLSFEPGFYLLVTYDSNNNPINSQRIIKY